MGLPPGEVHLHEVLAWAQEQTPFLRSVSARFVLFDLCLHAWRHDRNGEGQSSGDVMRKHANLAAIQRTTGLSKSAVKRALVELQTAGYVVPLLENGNGFSSIGVYWSEAADQMRKDARAGIKALPVYFQRPEKSEKKGLEVVQDAVILQFPAGSE